MDTHDPSEREPLAPTSEPAPTAKPAPMAERVTEPDSADEREAVADPEPDWKRKRRLAEIFGDVLPATTSDERGSGAPRRTESAQDAWLKSQVPPHHGGH